EPWPSHLLQHPPRPHPQQSRRRCTSKTSTRRSRYPVSPSLPMAQSDVVLTVCAAVLKASLRSLFKAYGEALDVVAHSNLRMRGQAFVSFESAKIAKKALKEVRGFPLYSKPMQISFARTRSDAVVKKIDAAHYEEHKMRRLEHKKAIRYTNPLKRKYKACKQAMEMDGTGAVPVSKRLNVQMPDEYLPPNKISSCRTCPRAYPNLHEVRLIRTKKDIAFVEYMDESSATMPKDALHNYKLDGENKIKITFARK
ncbi:uncharacterized protein C8Q71DRAFT_791022, partial [Rhodofomes roseus]